MIFINFCITKGSIRRGVKAKLTCKHLGLLMGWDQCSCLSRGDQTSSAGTGETLKADGWVVGAQKMGKSGQEKQAQG